MFRTTRLFTIVAALGLAPVAPAGQDCKVTVCHVPGGDVSKVHPIEIGVDALDAHLAHGDFMGFDGSCYVFVDEPACFDEAEASCRDMGGHLVSIHSAEENDYVATLADMGASVPGRVWIGAVGTGPSGDFCDGQSGIYEWTDGSTWDYEEWRDTTSEPNGCGSGGAPIDAVMFFSRFTQGTNAGWNDVRRCGPMLPYVCKLGD